MALGLCAFFSVAVHASGGLGEPLVGAALGLSAFLCQFGEALVEAALGLCAFFSVAVHASVRLGHASVELLAGPFQGRGKSVKAAVGLVALRHRVLRLRRLAAEQQPAYPCAPFRLLFK